MNHKTIVLLLLLTTPFWVLSQEQQVDTTVTVTDTTVTVKDTMPPKKKGLSSVNDGPYIFIEDCLLYTSPSPRDATLSRMPSSA